MAPGYSVWCVQGTGGTCRGRPPCEPERREALEQWDPAQDIMPAWSMWIGESPQRLCLRPHCVAVLRQRHVMASACPSAQQPLHDNKRGPSLPVLEGTQLSGTTWDSPGVRSEVGLMVAS